MISGFGPFDIFLNILIYMGILWFSITIHEAAHAWSALRLGDPTAKHQGRVSLNPLDHIDPIGTVLLPLLMLVLGTQTGQTFLFGWAKPTPFNPWNLVNPKRDAALISLAGPLSNLIIAVVFAIIFRLTGFSLLAVIVQLNVVLSIFNLIPIHPLDGFKIVGGFLPKKVYLQWMEFERYGPIFLIFVFFFGSRVLGLITTPITYFLLGGG